MTRLAGLLCLALLVAVPAWAGDAMAIVAAENFYGDVARQIAGPEVRVTSILSNPDQDPHLFEASPSTARALSGADLVIYNGADYDPWMAKLLAAGRSSRRRIIVVADLLHRRTGINPHLWYDPETMPAVARAIAAELPGAGPRLQAFLASLQPIDAKIAQMRKAYAGIPVTATEPVFGYMAAALGLTMRNERFQLAVMNNTEPSAGDTAAFERDLQTHSVRVLIYNSQATDSSALRLMHLAETAKIPVVGVTETEPAGKTYQEWMLGELEALDRALAQ
ncbi:MAG: zinc ABC transporter substrate-binding protein [Acidisphaera sp.]|nr:zinc ABC transporter substrate-binding protein [Acidisphaera sp.]